jgi:threonine synthase
LKTDPIKYYSTNLKAPEVSFREALLKGLAPDGGLYMPVTIPRLSREEIKDFLSSEYYEIAFKVLISFLGNELDSNDLKALCRDAYNFKVPVEKVFSRNYVLRLDQGPSASFKDFAARIMARLMNYFISLENQHFTILTATSGDTGSAVANAFHGLTNIDVIILFPMKEVTGIQRKQMTTLHKNIRVIAVDAKFDDCQKFVKKAFLDASLGDLSLTSANSINIGRLIPQTVYYFYSWSRLAHYIDEPVIFSVPSGNYGNLMGGIIAREMGLPVKKMIIATNENNEVPEYLRSGIYKTIDPSINCISNAMNVGHPSNLARIIALYGGVMDEKGTILKSPDIERMRNDFFGVSLSDSETRTAIAKNYKEYNLILEPHGAVAWEGMQRYHKTTQAENTDDQMFISLETAHPAKFDDEVRKILGFSPEMPESLTRVENVRESFIEIENNYETLRELLLKQENQK